MKANLHRDDLRAAVKHCATVNPGEVGVKATEGGLLVAARSDTGLATEHEVPADVAETGAIAVDGRRLASALAACSDEMVDLATKDGLLVKSGTNRYTLQVFEHHLRDIAQAKHGWITVDTGELGHTISSVLDAVSKESSRYALTGVWVSDGQWHATDGHRMQIATGPDLGKDAIVPGGFAKLLWDMDRASDSPVELLLGGGQIVARSRTQAMASPLIEAKYPAVQEVIPKEHKGTVSVAPHDLSSAIASAVAVCSRTETVTADIKPGLITVQYDGENTAVAQCECKTEYTGKIAFNAQYMMQALWPLGAGCEIRLVDSLSPIVITDCDEYLAVVMPTRL